MGMLTIEKAIETLKREFIGDSELMEWAKQQGALALEKQIPKKPIAKYTIAYDGSLIDVVFVCPVCNRMICIEPEDALTELLKSEYPHCHCGQALDWSSTE